MNFQKILDNPYAVGLAYTLGQSIPYRSGYKLADFIAAHLAAQKNLKLVQAVRANQWVVRGETLGKEGLDHAVHETLQHAARSIFDLYHYIKRLEAAKRQIIFDSTSQSLITRPEFSNRGLVVVGLHMSCFDLVLHVLCRLGMKMTVLTIPDPQGGRFVEYDMRRRAGMNILPISNENFRYALDYLRKGGIVLTGLDRPRTEARIRPLFFGRPSMLPMQYIYLAIKAQVPVMIIVANQKQNRQYHIYTTELIEMDHHPDREKEMIINTEKVLSIAEDFIRRLPQQWSISLPVWQDISDLVPG